MTALLAMLVNNAAFESKCSTAEFIPRPAWLRDIQTTEQLKRDMKLVAWRQKISAAKEKAKAIRNGRKCP